MAMTRKELQILGLIAQGLKAQNSLLLVCQNETNLEQIQAFHNDLFNNNRQMAG
jgi:hypothetical protein